MEKVVGFDALYESAQKCKEGVLWKDSVAHYILNIFTETLKLEEQLKSGTYHSRALRPFSVTSTGKKRIVMGVAFRDRVFQRSLNDNAIYPQITKSFIYDNAACQKGKGTDFARGRLVCFLHRFYRKHKTKGYVLQCDISGYYPNMRHDAVEATFKRYLEPKIYEMAINVLHTQYPGEVGYLPGSQMIQIAGIAVLNDLDHYIKEKLHIKHYIRYMDDLVLIHEDAAYLEDCRKIIARHLAKIGFQLHPKKTKIYPLSDGIKFLGFTHRLNDTGKVVVSVIPNNVKAERRKLRRLVNLAKKGRLSRQKVDQCYQSRRAHASKGDTYRLLRRMDEYYKELWS